MKTFVTFFLLLLFIVMSANSAKALDQSNVVANNKFGVHILFPSEIQQAARIVNTSGGDWGYVTIPIQSIDRDLQKWQKFMDDCRTFHLIPIIRLATEGDFFVTSSWRKPVLTDVLDFANFLTSLSWPTKTHYIIIYNEVNRNDEWGGQANPAEYANLLSYAVTIFKSKRNDYFIISAGLDNASVNSSTAISEYSFFRQMNNAVPGIFNQIDGISSHSYPNPGFSSPPTSITPESIHSFQYESDLIKGLSSKNLPIFITETGWSRKNLTDETISAYFESAFNSVWNDDRIQAVTPFLLFAASDPFAQFSILGPDLSDTPLALSLKKLPKVEGKPVLNPDVLAAEIVRSKNLPVINFGKEKNTNTFRSELGKIFKIVFPQLSVVK